MIKTVPDLPALNTLTGTYDEKSKRVHLHWQYKGDGRYFFVLYKKEGNVLSKFRSLRSDESEFYDDKVPSSGESLLYAIQVIYYEQRKRTKLGEPIVVNTPATSK